MPNSRLREGPQIALGVLVAVALAAGLWTIGGPLQGRIEKRDETRYEHLLEMNRAIECVIVKQDNVAPDTFDPGDCFTSQDHQIDPYTNEPYTYEKLSQKTYKLCAGFEDPETLARTARIRDRFDPETGCITFVYKP